MTANPTIPPEAALPTGPPPFPASEAQANLAVRIRRSLDLRLDDLLHQLRREGIRSSKAELVEMLLWELPNQLNYDLETRLSHFRNVAPRR